MIPSPWAQKTQKTALIAGGIGLAATLAGAALNATQFFRSYLFGFLVWFGVAFGCLAIQMIHALSGGRWGALLRRPLYAASTTIPALFVLFLPILAGVTKLYPWAVHGAAEHDALLRHKAPYLNVPFFIARAIACFAVWSLLAVVLYRRAARRVQQSKQAEGKDLTEPSGAMRRLAAPGLVAGILTISIAAVDWVMSLDPHWFSTLFGFLLFAGQLLSALAFVVVVLRAHAESEGLDLNVDALHDVGNFLLVAVMLWAYLSFSQYLIIYAGNMAEDVPFYVHRQEGGYKRIAQALIALHFIAPFLILLSRRTKRSPRVLAALALFLFAMRFVEIYWLVMPNFNAHALTLHWMDVAAPVGIGGVWLWVFLRRFDRSEVVSAKAGG